MSLDIGPLLAGWDYDPEGVSVRVVAGNDGREKLQIRLDLGLLQLELSGRPDGRKVFGFDSYFEFYQEQLRLHEKEAESTGESYALNRLQCEELLREGLQFYRRYVAFWKLGRFELCARDTARNLKLFHFVKQYAEKEEYAQQFDQWRPYVLMMHAKAVATPLVEAGDLQGAISAVEHGIREIESFLEEYGQTEREETCEELQELISLRAQLQSRRDRKPYRPESADPRVEDEADQLKQALKRAIDEERYEDAAELRDKLHHLIGEQDATEGT